MFTVKNAVQGEEKLFGGEVLAIFATIRTRLAVAGLCEDKIFPESAHINRRQQYLPANEFSDSCIFFFMAPLHSRILQAVYTGITVNIWKTGTIRL